MCRLWPPAERHDLAQTGQTFVVGAGGKEGTVSWKPCLGWCDLQWLTRAVFVRSTLLHVEQTHGVAGTSPAFGKRASTWPAQLSPPQNHLLQSAQDSSIYLDHHMQFQTPSRKVLCGLDSSWSHPKTSFRSILCPRTVAQLSKEQLLRKLAVLHPC